MELSFMDAFTLWCRAPYPSLGSTPELKSLRADLGAADEQASVVKAFLRTGRFRPSGADVLAELGDIVSRADAMCAEYEGSDLEAAREIRAYAALLAVVYAGFLKEGESG
ncbi:hypothetical protein FHR83_000838 [Actinoplanes campanulatus]|uniref:Uncharacterized protein n=1 Tax=Actinoplanes campanulatus TaxID=113559 RepID=A0A7W5FC95_9ACTN|nr:hypothetical protein [Actinoplanes campanulatus]MBB3093204.1 hypothetical protein [Actinoplanes campanulatus]GGN01914.1 hypothetical protein GCM10010109_07660 [Actinoplanes campanulatus]GID33700.1 hypothetical protein Aca09nite_02060 [Actinoplanes campanulatus]